jgi:hypothetical protein
MPVMLRQEDCEFEACMSYVERDPILPSPLKKKSHVLVVHASDPSYLGGRYGEAIVN